MSFQASFKKDLKLYPGPKDLNGSPTFNLYNPLTANYYKLGWEESYIYKLAKTGMTYAEIAEEVNKNSTLTISEEDVNLFFQSSAQLGLLDLPKSSEQVFEEFQKKKGSALWWILMHYLYFRIPLFKPDAFLERTLNFAKIFWSETAIKLYLVASFFGIIAILTHFDEYLHTFTYFFNWEGALMYGLAIWFVKIIHELSHAYVAKNYNIKVHSIGFAVIVLWPVLYTDVTDSWKLSNRKQRLAISIAGVLSELVIAGLSSFAWAISPPGMLQSVFFLLSSTTWISSLFINFNPAMRFDGYYILSDLWGIDNLRGRAFAIARWKLREWLFGFNLPCPEDDLKPSTLRGMVIYSFFTWSYLLIVYTLIALFVYHEFAKALGIILFLLEIAIFFIWPFVTEFKELYQLKSNFRFNLRTVITFSLLTLFLLWIILPLPHANKIASVTIPEEEQVLYVVEEGRIKNIYFKQGDNVLAGQSIIQISQEKIESEINKKIEEKNLLERLIQISAQEQEQFAFIPEKKAELLSIVNQLQELEAGKEYLTLKALIDGNLFYLDETLRIDQPVKKQQILGKIAPLQRVNVIAFVPENLVSSVYKGQKVEFALPYSSTVYSGTVSYIESVPVSVLDYPALASLYKGPLAVTVNRKNNTFRLVDSYFKAKIILEDTENLPFGKTGSTLITAPPESLLFRGMRYLYSVLLQESSL